FAIGTSYQDGGEFSFGIFERIEKNAHVGEVELLRRRARQFVAERVHAGESGFVGHRLRFLVQVSGVRSQERPLPHTLIIGYSFQVRGFEFWASERALDGLKGVWEGLGLHRWGMVNL